MKVGKTEKTTAVKANKAKAKDGVKIPQRVIDRFETGGAGIEVIKKPKVKR